MRGFHCAAPADGRTCPTPRSPTTQGCSTEVLSPTAAHRPGREYRSRSLYRVCGGALIAAGILLALTVLATALPQPASGARAVARIGHTVLLWLGTLAPPLVAGALLAIARHYRGTSREGWVLLAVAANVVGGTLLVLTFALAAVAAPTLPDLLRAPDASAAGALGLTPLVLLVAAARAAGGTLFWLSLLPLSIALARDRLWPRPVSWGAGVVAIVEVAVPPAVPAAEPPVRLAGCLYLALLGLAALRMIATLRAVAAEAARADDEEA